MNVKSALVWAIKELKGDNVSEPDASASVLLADVLGMTRTKLLASPEKKLTPLQVQKFRRYVSRRKKHESVWHIIGKVQFWGLSFNVDKNVLVPRPETELLVQEALKEINNSKLITQNSNVAILDLGTGSGTVAIALAHHLGNVIPAKAGIYKKNRFRVKPGMTKFEIVATDISEKALRVAKKNAKSLKVEKYIKFVKADLFPSTANKFDVITANLPYIPTEDLSSLAIDVHHYEPRLALDGGQGGLEIYEKMLSKAGKYLNPGGFIFCEIGIKQGEPFTKLVKKYLPGMRVEVIGDLAGIDRVAIISAVDKTKH